MTVYPILSHTHIAFFDSFSLLFSMYMFILYAHILNFQKTVCCRSRPTQRCHQPVYTATTTSHLCRSLWSIQTLLPLST